MKTQTIPRVKFSTGRGRPRNTVKINRRLTVDFQDFKTAVGLMAQKVSLTAIEKTNPLDLKSLRAIRSYAIEKGYIKKCEGRSLGNLKRSNKKTVAAPVQPVKEVVATPDLFDLVSDFSPFKPYKEEVVVETPVVTQRTLTIDFKGIKMQVEIASIEVKGDTIVVR